MRLKKMVLVGYTRFPLSNIQRFVYTPESSEQVILGSNGAGKSSLLSEIMNLVPNGRDFATGGFKEYHFEHDGLDFVLISTYNVKAGSHSFTVNGIEMNDGNTQATQRELVVKYTGLTQDLVDLMTGKARLSRMSPAKRREWLMKISGTDFTFALQLHDFFNEKSRDLKGTIAYLLENTHKMASEIESLEEDYKTKDEEVAQLKELSHEISNLLSGRIAEGYSESAIKKMTEAYQKVKQRSDTILAETIRRNAAFDGLNKPQVETKLTTLRDRMMQWRGECNEHEKALEGIQSLIKHVGRESMDDPSGLIDHIASLEEEIAELNSQGAQYECHGQKPEGLLAVAEGILEGISELSVTIPSNALNTYTRSGNATLAERHKSLNQYCIETNNIISKFDAQLEHASHTPETECPKCTYSFKPGWDPALLASTQNKLGELREAVVKASAEMTELNLSLDDFEGYSRKLNDLGRIRSNSTVLKTFWDTVAEEQLVKNFPAKIQHLLKETIARLTRLVRLERYTKDLEDLKSRLELIKNSGDPKYLLSRADMLESQIFDKSNLMQQAVVEVGVISEELDHLEKLNRLVAEMNLALSDFELYKEIAAKALEEDCLDSVRDRALARLGILHQQTQRYRDLTARYENNREQIEEAESRFGSYKLITKALSPTEGIIAEAVKSFLGHFVAMINDHIGMVWNYDMRISAVVDDGVNLNCKFPIHIGGAEEPVPDLADGSTGQVSMIDFAFKLVVAELLGLVDYPLLADEFGKDFDDEHRERLVMYIKSLMEQGKFSQLFMVSHYSAMYGSFNHAEFVVLDDRNITRPGGCNQNVVIE